MAYAEFNTGANFDGSIAATNVAEYGTADIVCSADGDGSVTLTYRNTYTTAPVVVVTAGYDSTNHFKSITYTVNPTSTNCTVYAWNGLATSTVTTQYIVAPNLY